MPRPKIRKHYPYKNITKLAIGIVIAIFLFNFEPFHQLLLSLGTLGFIGAFLAGILFVSSFTFSTGVVILLVLAEQLNVWEVAVLAGLGAVMGDLLIFKFVKDELTEEIKPIIKRWGGKYIQQLLHSKYFSWTFPLLGAIIIASPLPDEIGVSLLGISKMNTGKFLLLSFVLNSLGILALVTAANWVKP